MILLGDDATGPPIRPGGDADVEVHFVDTADEMSDALRLVDAEVVGVDVERADSDHYFRRAALVQVGVRGRCVLFDTVALDALPELATFLAERHPVLHAVENDLDPLRKLGVEPPRMEDTAVAAAILGLPTGLGPLLEVVLGIALDADKERYQRADWQERPLSAGMAAYAAGDVVHLPALWAELETRLESTGRRSWYEQELAATVESVDIDTRHWTRVKGAGRLGAEQRSVLRALWEERERLAREHDVAPNRLLHDDVLRAFAEKPPTSDRELVRRAQRRRALVRRHAEKLLAAVERGLAAAPEGRDHNGRRWTAVDRARFDALRKTRAEVADDLGIDAGVLCPSRPLWQAIAGEPRDGRELCALVGLRPWQTDLLAEPLWAAWVRAGQEHAPEGPMEDGGPADA